ncbi:serine hydrolase domain-containing protein [Nonomuraea roseoviolacea]|uniref:D-alanyl-D-alanine carboxypeptidase n=1 Tax=Nonomuraea roseoviolacea subsp. carminata TaxID=160689 RepID=A0ABT1K4W2_9ACTN|nr:serine hydrolase domain-containing protein [Nonomuraea roseoviolacea]MCP2349050.1 D-alanyl-D-alanine carboxypeptidase [Nonomuraea roseoviolacea subsp. carminata]
MRIRLVTCASVAALSALAGMVTAGPAAGETGVVPAADTSPPSTLDPASLKSALDEVHRAGVPGVYAEVRDSGRVWRGASGVADLETGRPVKPGMLQRVGSVTKTFTAAAVMQQVEKGRIRLDDPISRYLPKLVPGERGKKITVKMLLNHTSGLPEYLPYAFPSLAKFPSVSDMSPKSLDDNRFRRFSPAELIDMALKAPAAGAPGETPGTYTNANYLILGLLLERVTGTPAEKYITENVIERAGLRHTSFPSGPRIKGPHPRMYESMLGLLDPPRDYSVYDMSWVGTGAALVSTMEDLNRFYGRLLAGEIVKPSSLAQMQRTVKVYSQTGEKIDYGLGLQVMSTGCGTFWGHEGSVWGAGTASWSSADGKRQMSVAVNLARWNKPDSSGEPQPHAIDGAMAAFHRQALCGDENAS